MKKILVGILLLSFVSFADATVKMLGDLINTKKYTEAIEYYESNKIVLQNSKLYGSIYLYMTAKCMVAKKDINTIITECRNESSKLTDEQIWSLISEVSRYSNGVIVTNEFKIKGIEYLSTNKKLGIELLLDYAIYSSTEILDVYNYLKTINEVDVSTYVWAVCNKVNKYEGIYDKFTCQVDKLTASNARMVLDTILKHCSDEEIESAFKLANRRLSKNLIDKKEEWTPVITYIRTTLEAYK